MARDSRLRKLEMLRRPPSRKTVVGIIGFAGVAVIAIAALFSFLHPLPPRTINMATGPEGSNYAFYGKRYQKLLAKDGIKVNLVPTAGGVENLKLLRDPHSGVQIGFVEGGVASEDDDETLASLGTVSYEPMWFFSRGATSDLRLVALRGKRISIGPEGSDSRALMMELLKHNALDIGAFTLLNLPPEEAADELLAGHIDGAVLMTSWGSPLIKRLIAAPGINLANFSRADAYVALFPSLNKLIVPAGVGDLERDRPPRDTALLATKTSLIVRKDLHPALQYLLLETAAQIHSHPGIFQHSGEFPGAVATEISLSRDARHYYKSGRPLLQRYLPFWLAVLVEQLGVLLLPIVGIIYPAVKSVMSLYGWGMQRKIFLIYGELWWIEDELARLGKNPPTDELRHRMEHLVHRTDRIRVSSNYIPMLYDLKERVSLVQQRFSPN